MTSLSTRTRPATGRTLARTVLASAAMLCAVQAANAQSMPPMGTPGASYIGLSAGPSDFSRTKDGIGGFPKEDHNTAYNIKAGTYFINPNLGAEIGYTHFGSVARAGGTTKAEGINISLVGKYPVNEMFNLLGKVGTTYARTEVSTQPASGLVGGTNNGFDWSYGVGAELVITPQWSAVLQYDEHFMKFANSDSERVSTTMLGVRMRF